MYHKLPKVEEMVAHELRRRPETRESDRLLTVYVYHDYYGITKADGFIDTLLGDKSVVLPSMETIGRCRRKLQERDPKEFGATPQTIRRRKTSEIEFYDYAMR